MVTDLCPRLYRGVQAHPARGALEHDDRGCMYRRVVFAKLHASAEPTRLEKSHVSRAAMQAMQFGMLSSTCTNDVMSGPSPQRVTHIGM